LVVTLPNSGLRVAVMIATRNRRGELRRTLNRLGALKPAPDEVWVAADGCQDGTEAMVRGEFPQVRLIANQPALGSIGARDRLMAELEADVIVSLDDDSYPVEEDFVGQVRRLFEEQPRLAVASFPQRTDEFPGTLEASRASFGPARWAGTYVNAAAAFRRSTYFALGGHVIEFVFAYDEPDFSLRCLAAGWEIRHVTTLTVRHHWASANRRERRIHQRHARNEQWSAWMRCPWPQVAAVSLFRAVRQGMYAASRGPDWLALEPEWWWQALKGIRFCLSRREPLPWPAYREWMKLVRRPVVTQSVWRRRRRAMGMSPTPRTLHPQIAIAATNPCHLWDMALELHDRGHLAAYYSGYPAWRLRESQGVPVRSLWGRTLAMYAMRRLLPPRWRLPDASAFAWQDEGFDAAVAEALEPGAQFIHGLPGQCDEIFCRAKTAGMRTVLNHATGPIEQQWALVAPEYQRAGFRIESLVPCWNEAFRERRRREMALADFHCCASSVVRSQLENEGLDPERIWVVPYGADGEIFWRRVELPPPSHEFRILWAGALTLRKGVRLLLEALELANARHWSVDFFGECMPEADRMISSYRGRAKVSFHGAVPQARLADAMRKASVLVLPSIEEGFGLVVAQALSCGLPCVVSDAVGARDLIRHRTNGSTVPSGNPEALRDELLWWEGRPCIVEGDYGWPGPADLFLRRHIQAMEAPPR
jgi:glycosyltransferase involved in cell wall biosynthesis